jgi:hypothetical protein
MNLRLGAQRFGEPWMDVQDSIIPLRRSFCPSAANWPCRHCVLSLLGKTLQPPHLQEAQSLCQRPTVKSERHRCCERSCSFDDAGSRICRPYCPLPSAAGPPARSAFDASRSLALRIASPHCLSSSVYVRSNGSWNFPSRKDFWVIQCALPFPLSLSLLVAKTCRCVSLWGVFCC